MMSMSLTRLFAEPQRIRVFAAVALGASTPAEIARIAGTSVKEAALALRRFTDQGFVVDDADGVRVNHELFRTLARLGADATPGEEHGYRDERVETLLRTFLRDGRLVRLPAQWRRKLVVLNHIASRAFQPGVRYSEREVNGILRGWCDGGAVDHVTVRRYLVDLQLLSRENGVYWVNPKYRADAEAVLT